jgi:hypothetical protein
VDRSRTGKLFADCYWLLERLAPGVEAAADNDALLAQARGTAARVR